MNAFTWIMLFLPQTNIHYMIACFVIIFFYCYFQFVLYSYFYFYYQWNFFIICVSLVFDIFLRQDILIRHNTIRIHTYVYIHIHTHARVEIKYATFDNKRQYCIKMNIETVPDIGVLIAIKERCKFIPKKC